MCLVAYERGNTNIKYIDPDHPLWAYVLITNDCNMSCQYCYNQHNHLDKISLSNYINILDRLETIGIKQVTLSGGEPVLHPDFEQILIVTKSKGFKTHVLTNGLEVSKILAADQAGLIDQLQFNWNIETYKQLIPAIKKIQRSRIAVTIPGTASNIESLQTLVSVAYQLGIHKLRIWELCGAGKTDTSCSIQDYDTLFQQYVPPEYTFKQSYDPDVTGDLHIPCLIASGVTLFINTNGDIVRCVAEIDSPKITNIFNNTAEEVLQQYRSYVATLPKKCFAR